MAGVQSRDGRLPNDKTGVAKMGITKDQATHRAREVSSNVSQQHGKLTGSKAQLVKDWLTRPWVRDGRRPSRLSV